MFSTTASTTPSCLHGVLQIGGQRNFNFSLESDNFFLVFNAFWKEQTFIVPISEKGANFTKGFTVSNSKQFLDKVQNNYLSIELSNNKDNLNREVIGFLRLPLHQFFIAYRDASLMNRLNDGNFPVISTNKWVPVLNSKSGEQIGELECLLAMGTEKQIGNVKNPKMCTNKIANTESTTQQHHFTNNSYQTQPSLPINSKLSKTSDLLNLLQKSLASTTTTDISNAQSDTQMAENNLFKLRLEIKSARNLPLTQSLKQKKKLNRSNNTKESHSSSFQTGEEPSTYVTFQAKEENSSMVKSHEGMVYSTAVIEKNCNPVWNKSFCISGPVKYIINKNERFILKVWKKTGKSNSHGQKFPCPMEDAIIGFASVDLSVLIENTTHLNAWFDIVDFSGHINGQIHVVANLVDDVKEIKDLGPNNQVDNLLDSFESSLDINNMNLCRAIKRKFTELEEISDRLRVRLLDVTGNNVSRELSDEQLDEFEHDLNTTVCEDENESFHTNCSSHRQ
ncbi:C2 domain-containing protein 3 isoform X2 [Episyrphus balteatus]|nr:C2 domain-containing protein 3 isoform X2 [Episyrphus balteatus]